MRENATLKKGKGIRMKMAEKKVRMKYINESYGP
jgi:hypothetical protein